MHNPFISILARLSVGRKLLLIYLLDMTAVIFISGILINEKYIAINFARDETRGNAYINVVRDALIDVALIGSGRWPAVIAGLVVLAIVCSRFRKSPAAAVLLLVTSGGLLAFAYVKLSAGIWAQGVIFLAFLAAVWIDRTKIDPSGVKRGTSSFLIPPGVLVAVLVIQTFLGLGSAVRDIARPYSNASTVARFIRDQGWDTDPIVGVPDNFVSPVVGYLESDHFYYANGRRWGSFVVWDSQRLGPIDFDTVMHDIDRFGPAVTLVASESEHVDAAVLGRHGFRVVAHFPGAIIPSENYVIYHR